MMTKQCEVCGRKFKPKCKHQKYCSEECRRAHKLEYLHRYNRERRELYREDVREYNRIWMADYRDRKKREEKEQKEEKEKNAIPADKYAEVQMQRTLMLVGRVEL